MSPTQPVYGYTDRMSYAPGDRVRVHASAAVPTSVEIDLVELGDGTPTPVAWAGAGRAEAHAQTHCVGSFAHIEAGVLRSADAFTVGAWLWPTAPARGGVQTLVAVESGGGTVALAVEGGDIVLIHDGAVVARAGASLRPHTWYLATATVADGQATVTAAAVGWLEAPATTTARVRETIELTAGAGVTLAASDVERLERVGSVVRGVAGNRFNGKLEAPFLIVGALSDAEFEAAAGGDTTVPTANGAQGGRVLGAWDLAPSAPGNDQSLRGIAGAPDGVLVNLPARGVTGVRWDGTVNSFAAAPEQYGAVKFHEDDLVDVGWATVFEAALPADLASGLYGIRMRSGEHADVIPVTILPTPASTAPILVVMPTLTYLAYANEHLFEGDVSALRPDATLDPRDAVRVGAPEYGLSQYDVHADGTGVFFSSAARAILTMRADYEMWLTESGRGYSGEMYLLRWLREEGLPFDVITDFDLHEQGAALLLRYAVVVTGAHPEYMTREMLDSFRSYRDEGGNIMYLGGNGFYHATGIVSKQPLVTEIRRGNSGIRGWESGPGEAMLTSTGEPSGLWRHRGRAPQKLVGVGMAAQGWDRSSPYRRTHESRDEAVSWIFDGVEGDEIGTVGAVRGGAAGDEIDRADVALGTPPGTVVLATSYGHSDAYQRAIEEVGMNLAGMGGGSSDPEVHADVTYTRFPRGGAVFSVGSIAWTGSLAPEARDPGVVAITRNVLRRFAGLS